MRIVKNEMKRNGTADDWVNGLRNIESVYQNLIFLLKCCERSCFPLDEQLVKRLEISILFYESKYDSKMPYGDHAVRAAEFFRNQKIDGLTDEDRRAIYFAIIHHHNLNPDQKTLGWAKDEELKLLRLLIVLDGMNILCHLGFYRMLESCMRCEEGTELLGKIPASQILSIIKGEYSAEEVEAMSINDERCALPFMAYNCFMFNKKIRPIEHMLPDSFLDEIQVRWMKLGKRIDSMIRMEMKNEKPLRYFDDV